MTRNRSSLHFRLVTRAGFALQSEGQRASRSFGNHSLAAVDPSGTHTVKVSLGNCKSNGPEKPAIDLT